MAQSSLCCLLFHYFLLFIIHFIALVLAETNRPPFVYLPESESELVAGVIILNFSSITFAFCFFWVNIVIFLYLLLLFLTLFYFGGWVTYCSKYIILFAWFFLGLFLNFLFFVFVFIWIRVYCS